MKPSELTKIAKENNIIVHFVERGDKHCEANGEEYYVNSSFCAGKEIWIGIYDNEDWMTASFFHEIGHILTTIFKDSPHSDNCLTFHYELDAWAEGVKIGQRYGYFIKPSTFNDFVLKSVNSYVGWEEREVQRPTQVMVDLINRYKN